MKRISDRRSVFNMKYNCLFFILAAILYATSSAIPVAAQSTATAGASLGLSANTTLLPDTPQLRYSMEVAGAKNAFGFTHTFVLANNNSASVTLTEIRPSCGCTTALLGQGMHTPLVLASGQQVSLDPFHLTPGRIDKPVWFFVAGCDTPAATLDLSGNILSTCRTSCCGMSTTAALNPCTRR